MKRTLWGDPTAATTISKRALEVMEVGFGFFGLEVVLSFGLGLLGFFSVSDDTQVGMASKPHIGRLGLDIRGKRTKG